MIMRAIAIQESNIYIALLEKGDATPWSPVTHRRHDLVPTALAYKHAERGYRTVSVSYQRNSSTPDVRSFARAIIWTIVDGDAILIGDGIIQPPNYAMRNASTELTISCRRKDYLVLQRAVMASVMADPLRYVPELRKAANLDDVDAIMEASTDMLEWTRQGTPFLASMFGDPDKLHVVQRDRLSTQDITPESNGAPPSEIVAVLNFEWPERHVVEQSVGDMITAKLSDSAIISQQDLMAISVEDPATLMNRSLLCTFNPKTLEGGWPEEESVIGNFFVRRSSLVFDSGPAVKDNPQTRGAIMDVLQDNSLVTAKAKGRKTSGDFAGQFSDRTDPTEGSNEQGGRSWVSLQSTTFKPPVLDVIGIQTMQRREVVVVRLLYGGQDFCVDNGEPPPPLSFQVSGIADDEITPEYEQDKEYKAGDLVQLSGVVARATIDHYSKQSSFWEDFKENDFESPDFGQDRWQFLKENQSSLGRTDLDAAASSAFGKRCIAWIARRLVVQMGSAARTLSYTFTIPLSDALELDPSWTVRILHHDLEGGRAEGKVTNIEAGWDFDNLQGSARVTIACAIGSGSGDPEGPDYDPEDDGSGETETGSGEGMRVGYTIFPYLPKPIGKAGVLSIDDRLFGWEQELLVMDPARTIKGVSYVAGSPVVDFLENDGQTSLELDFKPATEDSGTIQRVDVHMTKWRGPRQVEL